MSASSFRFRVGGIVRPADVYAARSVDDELFDLLAEQNEFCQIFGPPQCGKTSLMVRTARRLREQTGATTVFVNLDEIGVAGNAQQWFYSLLDLLRQELGEPEWALESNEASASKSRPSWLPGEASGEGPAGSKSPVSGIAPASRRGATRGTGPASNRGATRGTGPASGGGPASGTGPASSGGPASGAELVVERGPASSTGPASDRGPPSGAGPASSRGSSSGAGPSSSRGPASSRELVSGKAPIRAQSLTSGRWSSSGRWLVGRGDSEPPPAEGDAARANRMLRERNPAALLRESLLGWLESPERLYLFVDEIQNVRRLPNDARDDFLALLRAAHLARSTPSERGRDALWSRLCVCVAGIATPLGLGHEPDRTSYNIGRTVSLEDFPIDRAAQAFVPVLRRQGFSDAEKIFEYVYDWTSGHPFHTQRFCQELSERERPPERDAEDWVRELADSLAQTEGAYADSALSFAERRLLEPSLPVRDRLEALETYRRLLESQATISKPPEAEGARRGEGGKVMDLLMLSGLVAPSGGRAGPLRPRSRFFAHSFDQAWVDAEIAKLRRPLTELIERWRKNERNDEFLPRRGELDKLNTEVSFDDLTAEEREFWLRAQNVQSQRRLRAIALTAAAAALLGAIGGAASIKYQRVVAEADTRAAEQVRIKLEANRDATQGRVSVGATDERRQSALFLLGDVSAKLKDGTLAPEAAQIKLAEVKKVLDHDFAKALASWKDTLDTNAKLDALIKGECQQRFVELDRDLKKASEQLKQKSDEAAKQKSQCDSLETRLRASAAELVGCYESATSARSGVNARQEEKDRCSKEKDQCSGEKSLAQSKLAACELGAERARSEAARGAQELTAARDSAQKLTACEAKLLSYEPPSNQPRPPPERVPSIEGAR